MASALAPSSAAHNGDGGDEEDDSSIDEMFDMQGEELSCTFLPLPSFLPHTLPLPHLPFAFSCTPFLYTVVQQHRCTPKRYINAAISILYIAMNGRWRLSLLTPHLYATYAPRARPRMYINGTTNDLIMQTTTRTTRTTRRQHPDRRRQRRGVG